MKIEVGKKYLNRNGQVITIASKDSSLVGPTGITGPISFPLRGVDANGQAHSFVEGGYFWREDWFSEYDLVSEVNAPDHNLLGVADTYTQKRRELGVMFVQIIAGQTYDIAPSMSEIVAEAEKAADEFMARFYGNKP